MYVQSNLEKYKNKKAHHGQFILKTGPKIDVLMFSQMSYTNYKQDFMHTDESWDCMKFRWYFEFYYIKS